MSLLFKPVRVETGAPDEEGFLVFAKDQLVAVLVRLSELHGDMAGRWFIEAAFGRLDGPEHPSFDDLAAVEAWISERLAQAGRNGAAPRSGRADGGRSRLGAKSLG